MKSYTISRSYRSRDNPLLVRLFGSVDPARELLTPLL